MTFIYINSNCKIGDLVEVPFGLKKEIGVIWKNKYSEPQNIKLKLIKRKTKFSIDKKLIDFIEWFSSYNMVPIGLVLKMVIGNPDRFLKKEDGSLGLPANCYLLILGIPLPGPGISWLPPKPPGPTFIGWARPNALNLPKSILGIFLPCGLRKREGKPRLIPGISW